MNKKRAFIMMSLLILGAFPGCARGMTEEDNIVILEQEEEETETRLITAVLSDVVLTKNIRCTYAQLNAQQVRFPVSGKMIEKVYVKKGDTVEKGQLLAELSGGSKEEEIEKLEYQIARNRLQLEHLQENEDFEISRRWLDYIYKSQHSADAEKGLKDGIEDLQRNNRYNREDYEDTLALDERQLSALRQEEAQSRVYADFAGVASYVKEELEGSTSNREETIIQITDNSQCMFIVEDMTDAPYVREGQELDMQIVAGSGAGKYKMLPYKMEEWTDKMLFTIVGGGETTVIEAGTNGNLTLILEERKQVLSLPTSAVHKAEEEYYVYVVDESGNRQVKWIKTGLWGKSNVEIVEGLEEGEKVALK